MGVVETLYEDTDHVEHWDHPKPAPGVPCQAGTVHLHTFGPDYALGGLLGLADAKRLSRARLAELLKVPVEEVEYVVLGGMGGPAGFAFTLAADSRYGFARVSYGPKTQWTFCRTEHRLSNWWVGCECSIRLPRAPVAVVMQAIADMIRRGAIR